LVYNNLRELSWCLRKLESDPEICKRLGSNGNEYYEEHYRWDKLVPKFTAFLDAQMSRPQI
jgi:glycosyltransferase involved in cell wall biosynthesis